MEMTWIGFAGMNGFANLVLNSTSPPHFDRILLFNSLLSEAAEMRMEMEE